ncbi:GNAT family N-acetyltransferase [Rhodobacterales bacterium HKCCE4037]|nr:GNAT family N-acetyltransferase [Rhodobacterales bacterium HKCCE4037]
MSLEIRNYLFDEVAEVIEPLARLRISVFRDWPYLYDGDLDYERRYLADYTKGDGMVCAVFDGDRMVGAATAMNLAHQPQAVRSAFEGHFLKPEEIYYCAESVLLPDYRGRGLGHAFFDAREINAHNLNFTTTGFCSVIRPPDDPRRPADYRPLDAFWRKRGYAAVDGAVAHISWRDIGDTEETVKPLQVWLSNKRWSH